LVCSWPLVAQVSGTRPKPSEAVRLGLFPAWASRIGGMSEDRQKSGGGTGAIMLVVAILALLPILYVLSAGPVIWLIMHGYLSNVPSLEAIQRFSQQGTTQKQLPFTSRSARKKPSTDKGQRLIALHG
jgi:hypothetical protein